MGHRALKCLTLLATTLLLTLTLNGLAAATPTSQDGLLNLAAASEGTTARAANAEAGHEPEEIIDGDAETAWWAEGDGSLFVDFPGRRVLREVHVHLQSHGMPKVELAVKDGSSGYRILSTWSDASTLDLVYTGKGEVAAYGLRVAFPEPLVHTHSYVHRHCRSWSPLTLGLANRALSLCYSHVHTYQDKHHARVAEVEAWGTLPDADMDGLSDEEEVAGWEVVVTRAGKLSRYSVTSDPLQPDADEDGLTDLQERDGGTDPGAWDTDGDGVWDDEDLGPLSDDADGDGVPDGVDRVPDRTGSLEFRTRFPPGLVRFRQPFSVFSLEGMYAWVDEYNYPYGACQFRSDETTAATRSSVVDGGRVLAEIQRTFAEGDEENYAPTRAARLYDRGSTYHHFTYGGCDFWSPKEYRIGYAVHEDKWGVDFVNVREVEVPDGEGGRFQFALERIPVRRGHPISLVMQYTLPVEGDQTSYEDPTRYRVGAMGYTIYGSSPGSQSPLFSNAAVAAGLTEGAYQLELRIPGSVTARAPEDLAGRPYLEVLMLPFWLDVQPYGVRRLGWDMAGVRWAGLSLEVPIFVHQIIARLSIDVEEVEAVLPLDLGVLASGLYSFAGYRVYIHRASANSAFDPGILGQVDAVVLLGMSESDVIAVRDALDWGPPGTWYEEASDAFNTGLKWFKTSSRLGGLAIHFLEFRSVVEVLVNGKVEFPGIPTSLGERDVVVAVEKVKIAGKVMFIQTRWATVDAHVTVNGVRQVWEVRKPLEVGRYERLEDVPALKGRYTTMRAGLRGAAVGAVLVTWGRAGILAFAEGEYVKGSVYTAATSVSVFSTLRSEVPLSRLGLKTSSKFLSLGKVGIAAVGTIFASYHLYLAAGSSDSITQLSHLEHASAWTIDTPIMAMAPYGTVVVATWSITVALLSTVMPNDVAASVTSTPGAFVTFVVEYIFGGGIPSSVSEDAFESTASWAVSQMRQWNSVFQIPSVVILP